MSFDSIPHDLLMVRLKTKIADGRVLPRLRRPGAKDLGDPLCDRMNVRDDPRTNSAQMLVKEGSTRSPNQFAVELRRFEVRGGNDIRLAYAEIYTCSRTPHLVRHTWVQDATKDVIGLTIYCAYGRV